MKDDVITRSVSLFYPDPEKTILFIGYFSLFLDLFLFHFLYDKWRHREVLLCPPFQTNHKTINMFFRGLIQMKSKTNGHFSSLSSMQLKFLKLCDHRLKLRTNLSVSKHRIFKGAKISAYFFSSKLF